MNVEFIDSSDLTFEDSQIAKMLSEKFDIGIETASLLLSKGIKTAEEAREFLYPENVPSPSPYLLTDMDKLVSRIKKAVDENEKMVVYGDYDADGICAAYILFRAIKALDENADVSVFIPDRKFGYGISDDTIELLAEEFCPDLVITCDLGISSREEIKVLIEEAGIDVLVSDHHELPECIPDCPCVNPKRDIGKYPCTELCGAGVSYKIAEALVPEKLEELIEFAAIATVADSVPLIGENRKIVKEGLKRMNANPSAAIKALADNAKLKGELTSSSIAFVIAPRINASGRMGEAARSLQLFLKEDYDDALEIVEEISQDNFKRQKICAEIYDEAFSLYNKESGSFGIVLMSENWHAGLLGIVASKISEEYHKPAILFSFVDGNLRGSGRSVEGINLFEALSSMSELFITFGGHSQACGLTISKANFPIFKERFNEYLKKNAKLSNYIPTVHYDIDCNKNDVTMKTLDSLRLLEPFGVGNPKPRFFKTAASLMLYPSSNPNHLIGDGEEKYLTCFNFGKYLDVLRGDVKKNLILDYHIDEYNGKRSVKANLKSFYTVVENGNFDDEDLSCGYLFALDGEYYRPISDNDYLTLLKEYPFGVLTIANTTEGIKKARELLQGVSYLEEANAVVVKSNLNRLLIAPKTTVNFEKFHTVVFVEEKANVKFSELPQNAQIFTLGEKSFFEKLDVTQNRELFLDCYRAIKALSGKNILSYKNLLPSLSEFSLTKTELLTAYAVFKELELISVSNNKLSVAVGKKVDLSLSTIYNILKK